MIRMTSDKNKKFETAAKNISGIGYDAFISYSHLDCGVVAPAIQKAIENIGKPWYMLKRNLTIYRDETNLAASPNLWNNIENALSHSNNFILLASPLASQSYWIKKEVENWIESHCTSENGLLNIYIIKTSGDLVWNFENGDWDWEKTNCLPTVLKNKFLAEPLWIDLSEFVNQNNLPINYESPTFTAKLVKVVAGILNKTPREVESDELSRKRNITFALTLTSIAFLLIVFGIVFFYSKNRSNTELAIANEKLALTNEKNSISNNLIAEGNKYGETNINKTLLLYGYAYSINEDTSVFKILNNFYNSYTTYELNTFIDSINLFYSKKYIIGSDEELKINIILDSLNLLNSSKINELIEKNSSFYFETDIKIQIANLKKQNQIDDVEFSCSGDRYNFVLQDKFLYIYLGKMHEGDADYYLDYVEIQPLFKLQLLYNDSLENNAIKIGEYHNWEEKFKGIYFDKMTRKLFILAKKEQWVDDNIQVHHELYTFDLFTNPQLTSNKNQIVNNIIKYNGQFDLSNSEKKRLKVIE